MRIFWINKCKHIFNECYIIESKDMKIHHNYTYYKVLTCKGITGWTLNEFDNKKMLKECTEIIDNNTKRKILLIMLLRTIK